MTRERRKAIWDWVHGPDVGEMSMDEYEARVKEHLAHKYCGPYRPPPGGNCPQVVQYEMFPIVELKGLK